MKAICGVMELLEIIIKRGNSEDIKKAGRVIECLEPKDKKIMEERTKVQEMEAEMKSKQPIDTKH